MERGGTVNRKVLKGRKGDTKKRRDNYRAKNSCVPFEYIEYFAVQQRFFFRPVQQKTDFPEGKSVLISTKRC
jgi:hypothetical protein